MQIRQCLKLRFCIVHLPSEKIQKLCTLQYSCVNHYINQFKIWLNHAHTGSTCFKIYAPNSQNVHTGYSMHPLEQCQRAPHLCCDVSNSYISFCKMFKHYFVNNNIILFIDNNDVGTNLYRCVIQIKTGLHYTTLH